MQTIRVYAIAYNSVNTRCSYYCVKLSICRFTCGSVVLRVVVLLQIVPRARTGRKFIVGTSDDHLPADVLSVFLTSSCSLVSSRFITIFASGGSASNFNLRTLRAVRVLRPLKLVSGVPSTYLFVELRLVYLVN